MKWLLPTLLIIFLFIGFLLPVQRADAQTTRNVVGEEFTGTWCGWCPYGRDTLVALLKDYPNFMAIAYHQGDVMQTTEGNAFISAMNPAYPQAAIDRVLWSGQPKIPISRDIWRSKVLNRLNVTSPLSITVSGTYNPATRLLSLMIHLDILQDMTGQWNLNVIVMENGLNYQQYKSPEGIYLNPYYHDHVVRKMVTGASGKTLTTSGFSSGASRDTTINYILSSSWVYNNLYLAVMVSSMNGSTYQPHGQGYEARIKDIAVDVPVELMSFLAQERDDRSIRLSWIAATQKNNAGWEVQRSLDKSQWTTLGFVRGNGTTNERLSYEFIDASVAPDVNYYYRLKQIDVDGTTEYSLIAMAWIDLQPQQFALEQNYPNPFTTATTIVYALPAEERVTLTVFDNLGRVVKTLSDGLKPAGNWNAIWDGTDNSGARVSEGTYFITLNTPTHRATKQMLVLK